MVIWGLWMSLHSVAPVSQDLSSAGKRVGLAGNRSSLFFEAVRIIREMRKATNFVLAGIVWAAESETIENEKGGGA